MQHVGLRAIGQPRADVARLRVEPPRHGPEEACAILLSLLYLGIKDIRLGPSLPAFVSPNVLDVLVKNFNIMPIKTPDEDLKAILG